MCVCVCRGRKWISVGVLMCERVTFVVGQTSHQGLFLTSEPRLRAGRSPGLQTEPPFDPGFSLPTFTAAAGSHIHHFYYLIKNSYSTSISLLARCLWIYG